MHKTPLAIITHPNDRLRLRAAEVTHDTLARLEREGFLAALAETMRVADGVGIAATQVGALHRVIVVMENDVPQFYVNPIITSRSIRTEADVEGCLSVPGIVGTVRRAKTVTVRAHDITFRPIVKKCRDLTARIMQHEVDHLDGILFIDRAISTATLAPHAGEMLRA